MTFPFPLYSPPAGDIVLTEAAFTMRNDSRTLTMPTIEAGDIAIYSNVARNGFGGAPSAAYPSGFTSIGSLSANSSVICFSYKILAGTESGSSVSGASGTKGDGAGMVILRPSRSVSAVTGYALDFADTISATASTTATISARSTPGILIGYTWVADTNSTGELVYFTPGTNAVAKGSGYNDLKASRLTYRIFPALSTPSNTTVYTDAWSDSPTARKSIGCVYLEFA